jgi:hypothetical protein
MVANWETLASLGTAAGTLVLAVATFASVRSANRAARTAERALGGRAVAQVGREETDVDGLPAANDVMYLALSLRNAGSGLAVLHGWRFAPERLRPGSPHPAPQFRPQTRDLYIAPGDIGFWQGALRDPTDPQYEQAKKAVETRQPLTIDLLYGDYEGGQRVQTRFGLVARPRKDDKPDEDIWLASVSLHHNVDRPDPRDAPLGFDGPAA